jgi:RNA polymerase sigma-70 factor (ECF subfamily)
MNDGLASATLRMVTAAEEDRMSDRDSAAARRAAFADIVERHQAPMARLAARLLGWPSDVDDVVQDVFTAAWRALPRFRGDSSVETWLTRITINACRKHRRRRFLQRMLLRRRPAGKPPTVASHADSNIVVRRAVSDLPTALREVVVLHYLQEMEVPQVAAALGISANVVYVRLHRARQKLAPVLKCQKE